MSKRRATLWRGDCHGSKGVWEQSCLGAKLWEQSLLAIQAPRFLKYRVVPIAGKPCSHSSHSFYSVLTPGVAQLACFICRTGNSTRKVKQAKIGRAHD